ncbi:MAG: hypothetical protein ACREIA_12345 [Opitutaceae bacterium]
MKKKSITAITSVGFAAVALTFTACSKNDYGEGTVENAAEETANTAEKAWDSTADAAKNLADDASTAAASTWNSIKDATYDERASFRSGVDKMAASIDRNVDQWSDKASTLPAASRDAWNEGLAELKDARSELSDKLDNLGDATAATWDDAKDGVQQAWDRVQRAYNDLKARMKS